MANEQVEQAQARMYCGIASQLQERLSIECSWKSFLNFDGLCWQPEPLRSSMLRLRTLHSDGQSKRAEPNYKEQWLLLDTAGLENLRIWVLDWSSRWLDKSTQAPLHGHFAKTVCSRSEG
jgi:hypothetical protein